MVTALQVAAWWKDENLVKCRHKTQKNDSQNERELYKNYEQELENYQQDLQATEVKVMSAADNFTPRPQIPQKAVKMSLQLQGLLNCRGYSYLSPYFFGGNKTTGRLNAIGIKRWNSRRPTLSLSRIEKREHKCNQLHVVEQIETLKLVNTAFIWKY